MRFKVRGDFLTPQERRLSGLSRSTRLLAASVTASTTVPIGAKAPSNRTSWIRFGFGQEMSFPISTRTSLGFGSQVLSLRLARVPWALVCCCTSAAHEGEGTHAIGNSEVLSGDDGGTYGSD